MKSTYLAILTSTSILITHTFFKKKNNLLQSQSIPSDIKKYYEFCTMFGLKQLIEVPTRVTCSSSTIIDHILASFPNRVSQQGVIDVGLSDHQIVYCTRKISRIKRGTHKEIRCRSLKNYSADIYEEALGRVDFLIILEILMTVILTSFRKSGGSLI